MTCPVIIPFDKTAQGDYANVLQGKRIRVPQLLEQLDAIQDSCTSYENALQYLCGQSDHMIFLSRSDLLTKIANQELVSGVWYTINDNLQVGGGNISLLAISTSELSTSGIYKHPADLRGWYIKYDVDQDLFLELHDNSGNKISGHGNIVNFPFVGNNANVEISSSANVTLNANVTCINVVFRDNANVNTSAASSGLIANMIVSGASSLNLSDASDFNLSAILLHSSSLNGYNSVNLNISNSEFTGTPVLGFANSTNVIMSACASTGGSFIAKTGSYNSCVFSGNYGVTVNSGNVSANNVTIGNNATINIDQGASSILMRGVNFAGNIDVLIEQCGAVQILEGNYDRGNLLLQRLNTVLLAGNEINTNGNITFSNSPHLNINIANTQIVRSGGIIFFDVDAPNNATFNLTNSVVSDGIIRCLGTTNDMNCQMSYQNICSSGAIELSSDIQVLLSNRLTVENSATVNVFGTCDLNKIYVDNGTLNITDATLSDCTLKDRIKTLTGSYTAKRADYFNNTAGW